MQRLVERIAQAPEVRAALASQGVGLVSDIGRGIRELSDRVDDLIDSLVARGRGRQPTPPGPQRVGLVTRAVGAAADAGIINLAFLGISALFGITIGGVIGDDESPSGIAIAAGSLAWLAGGATYLGLFWALAGQTPGMRLLSIRLDVDGERRIGFRRATRRLFGSALSVLTLGLGFLLVVTLPRTGGRLPTGSREPSSSRTTASSSRRTRFARRPRRNRLALKARRGAPEPRREMSGIAVENPATGETIATVPELSADEVARAGREGPRRAARLGGARLRGPRRGPDGRPRLDGRQRRAGRRRRSAPRPAAPPTRPSSRSSPTASRRSSSGPSRRPAYLADEEIESASPFVRGGRKLKVRYAPLGVVGVIGPWNFPLNNSFGDCIPALAAGNAVVLKPSEITPLTSLLMAEMLAECGAPRGRLPGRDRPRRDRRGARRRGRLRDVHRLGRDRQEGDGAGGRDADAGQPRARRQGPDDRPRRRRPRARGERRRPPTGSTTPGQVCISVERIYVEDAVHDEFVERLTGKVEALRQGPPGEAGTVDVGAIIFPPADRPDRRARPRRRRARAPR